MRDSAVPISSPEQGVGVRDSRRLRALHLGAATPQCRRGGTSRARHILSREQANTGLRQWVAGKLPAVNIEVDRMREMSRADFAAGEITEGNLRSHLASCDFCERHNALPVDPATRMDIWGLGEVNVWFVTLETGPHWIPLKQLAEPLGVEPADLYAYYREVRAQGRWLADAIEWIDDGGKTCSIEVVSEYFVSRALLDISPWAELYRESVADLWCHRFIAHGLTDVITDENGRTLTEVIAEKGLPSLEVARHQALSGLSGAVSRLGEQL